MNRRGRPPHPDVLTPREWEVLELLRQKLTNHEIAERLGLSVDGAKYHVSEIITKLGVADRRQAAVWATSARRRPLALPAILGNVAARTWSTAAGRLAFGATALAVLTSIAVLAWGLLTVKGGAVDLGLRPGVYVFEPSGDRLRRVSDSPYICDTQCGPSYDLLSWSPTGDALLINDSFGLGNGLLTVSTDGKSYQVLPFRAWDISWLPSGELAGYARVTEELEGGEALIVADPMGRTVRPLTFGAFGGSTFSGDGGSIIAVTSSPLPGLEVIDRATGSSRRLVDGEFLFPAWSPDSSAFTVNEVSKGTGKLDVAVFARDGVKLSAAPAGQRPIWSPDGRLIAATDYRQVEDGQEPWVVLVDPRGSRPPRDLVRGALPAFAADSKSATFIRDGELWQIGIDGKDERKLVSSSLPMIAEAHWSPDGSKVAFIAGNGGGSLFSINADGSDERFLAPGTRPLPSPDGSRIAFFYGSTIFAMSHQARDIVKVGEKRYSDAISPCTSGPGLSWSPDSRGLAYWTYGITVAPLTGGVVRIWDGTQNRRLENGYGPVWLPDGRSIAYTHFASTNPPSCAVSSVPATGGAASVLIAGALSSSWTKDGKYLAYLASQQPGPFLGELTIATAADNKPIRRLGFVRGFAWSPDSLHYAFVRVPGASGLSPAPANGIPAPAPPVLPPDATVFLVIGSMVPGGGDIEIPVLSSSQFAWSPDGRSLAYTSRHDPAAPSDIFVMALAHPESPRYLTSGGSPTWSAGGAIIFSR